MMRRKEFLEQLERLLWDIPEQERKEALEFYENYFDDAGEENEATVIQELGSPGKVAATIKADLDENGSEHGEYRETGYTDERFEEKNMPDIQSERAAQKPKRSSLSWALILLLAVITSPVWGALLLAGLGLIAAVVGAAIGVAAALFFGCIGLLIGGVICLGVSISQLPPVPTAALVAGAGLLMICIGFLLLLGFLWLAVKIFPICFRWGIDFIQRILHKRISGGERK